MSILDFVDHYLEKVEKWVIIILLSFLMIVAFTQVVLRNLFSSGFIWADILLRNSVLWIALLGASIATKERKHIAIDVVSKFFSIRQKYIIEIIISIISIYICHLLAIASFTFLVDERMYGSILVLNIPTWYFLTIVPFAFYSIAFRFFIRSLKRAVVLIKGAK